VFGQARYSLTDTLSVTLGGRFTDETKEIVSNQFLDARPAGVSPFAVVALGVPAFLEGVQTVLPIVTDLPGEASFDRFSPRIGLEWQPSDDLLIFASYAEGFRSGGFNGRLILPQPEVPTYEPDTNDAYELGFKSDLLDGMVRFNATAFYSKYEGIQQTIADPTVQFRVANAGNAVLYGAEVELAVQPTEAFRLDLGIGYTHSEFEDVPLTVGPIDGNALPFSPEWTVSVGAQYEADLGSLGTLTPRIDYRYQTEVFFTAFNLPLENQDAYELLSARLTWRAPNERFSIAVFGENITDEEYFTFGQNALLTQGVAYAYLGRPAEYGVTLSLEY
jgi:iron complex outermembrane receptor protein